VAAKKNEEILKKMLAKWAAPRIIIGVQVNSSFLLTILVSETAEIFIKSHLITYFKAVSQRLEHN